MPDNGRRKAVPTVKVNESQMRPLGKTGRLPALFRSVPEFSFESLVDVEDYGADRAVADSLS